MTRTQLITGLHRCRPVVRVVLWVVLLALALVVLALSLPGARRLILNEAIEQADRRLPGSLSVASARWPGPGRIALHGLRWSAGDTLLVRVDTLEVAVNLRDLVRRDLTVERLLLAGVEADVPAVTAHLPAPGPSSPDTTAATPPSFPRPGNLPPVPSIALNELALRRIAVTTGADRTLALDELTAAVDLRCDRPTRLALFLSARPLPDLGVAWRLDGHAAGDTLVLGLSPITVLPPSRLPAADDLMLSGRLAVPRATLTGLQSDLPRWPHLSLHDLAVTGEFGLWTMTADLRGRRPGQLLLTGRWPQAPRRLLAAWGAGAAWADSLGACWSRHGEPSVDLSVELEPPAAPGVLADMVVSARAKLLLPGPAALTPLLPPNMQVSDLTTIAADLVADYDGDGARVELDLGATPWLDRARILAHGHADRAVLDTLDLGLPGLAVVASGRLARPAVELAAEVHVPDATLLARWNDPALLGLDLRADLDLEAAGTTDSLTAHVRLDAATPDAGLQLQGVVQADELTTAPMATLRLDSLPLRLAEQRLQATAPCTLTVVTADSSVSLSRLDLAGELGRLDVTATATVDSLLADVGLDLRLALDTLRPLLPPPVQALLPVATLTLDGDARIHGAADDPQVAGNVSLGFDDNPDLAVLSATGAVTMTRRLTVDLALLAADTTLLHLSALAPRPGSAAVRDTVDVSLLADRTDLEHLQPLLPPGVSLAGQLTADPRLVGQMDQGTAPPDLAMTGALALADVRLGLPDGSWVAMGGQASLSGTTLEPVIRGGMRIEGGLLRIPDPPPILLPDNGEAILWETDHNSIEDPDQAMSAVEPDTGAPGILPDLEFALQAPGGLWLRGHGLDVDLAGDLVLRLAGGLPALEGELDAVGGTMRQLGQVFHLERGRVVFYADEGNLDPELDLAMGVKVDGADIRILLGGTANAPKLTLTSEPEMSDSDIMSLLLFGKTSDELDDGQAGFLAQRAAQLAAASSSVALQEKLARELGADVLTIAPAEDRDDATALTLGKYLNPKVLVRYEQLLADESAFYVHLDYALWRDLKLHTQVSQGEASGAALKWEFDW